MQKETYTLGKKDRLKSRKAIEQLFAKGKSFSLFPFKVIYTLIPQTKEAGLQSAFSVGKKYFKKAVDRNRVKRLMKEAYRLQKNSVKNQVGQNNQSLAVFIIFTGNELPEYNTIHSRMGAVIKRLLKISNEEPSSNI